MSQESKSNIPAVEPKGSGQEGATPIEGIVPNVKEEITLDRIEIEILEAANGFHVSKNQMKLRNIQETHPSVLIRALKSEKYRKTYKICLDLYSDYDKFFEFIFNRWMLDPSSLQEHKAFILDRARAMDRDIQHTSYCYFLTHMLSPYQEDWHDQYGNLSKALLQNRELFQYFAATRSWAQILASITFVEESSAKPLSKSHRDKNDRLAYEIIAALAQANEFSSSGGDIQHIAEKDGQWKVAEVLLLDDSGKLRKKTKNYFNIISIFFNNPTKKLAEAILADEELASKINTQLDAFIKRFFRLMENQKDQQVSMHAREAFAVLLGRFLGPDVDAAKRDAFIHKFYDSRFSKQSTLIRLCRNFPQYAQAVITFAEEASSSSLGQRTKIRPEEVEELWLLHEKAELKLKSKTEGADSEAIYRDQLEEILNKTHKFGETLRSSGTFSSIKNRFFSSRSRTDISGQMHDMGRDSKRINSGLNPKKIRALKAVDDFYNNDQDSVLSASGKEKLIAYVFTVCQENSSFVSDFLKAAREYKPFPAQLAPVCEKIANIQQYLSKEHPRGYNTSSPDAVGYEILQEYNTKYPAHAFNPNSVADAKLSISPLNNPSPFNPYEETDPIAEGIPINLKDGRIELIEDEEEEGFHAPNIPDNLEKKGEPQIGDQPPIMIQSISASSSSSMNYSSSAALFRPQMPKQDDKKPIHDSKKLHNKPSPGDSSIIEVYDKEGRALGWVKKQHLHATPEKIFAFADAPDQHDVDDVSDAELSSDDDYSNQVEGAPNPNKQQSGKEGRDKRSNSTP